MKTRDVTATFNRGRISRHALARVDVERVRLSAEVQTNWQPRVLGSMSLRPGLGYYGVLSGQGIDIPFVKSTEDSALIELSPNVMRIWDMGTELVTRAPVNASVTNGDFATDLTGWTDADDSGAASSWSAGSMALLGTGSAYARRRQEVSVTAGDENTIHALRITVSRGPALLRIGTTAGNDDIFRQAVLRTGSHSIAFTPGGSSFWIELAGALKYPVLIDDCTIESDGVLSLPTPWSTFAECQQVRWMQSADVIFCACGEDIQPRRIERRDNNSWSIVLYEANDGPFLTENTDAISVTPDAISGEITLTATQPIWQSGHVGAIWRLTSQGQRVEASLVAELTYTNPIRVTGVENDRKFTVSRSGTWSGTLSLQRSIGDVGAWVTVATYTGNATITYDDGLDNTIAYYRIGFEAGNFTSGQADVYLEFSSGSITGTARITAFTSSTEVDAIVLSDFGAAQATTIWAEGAWSDVQGWPESVRISDGRLWWSGQGRNYGSVSDAYASFDPDYEGDAAPINRRAGDGEIGRINWSLSLQRLVVGSDTGEYSVRSNSFDEPITPSNYNVKSPSTKGSSPVPAVAGDGRGYFVGRSGTAIYELRYSAETYDIAAQNVTLLVPEIGDETFTRLSLQQFPDMRVHCVRGDGTMAVLIRDPAEDVLCWVDIETDGEIQDVSVLPGAVEDVVALRVKRTVNGLPSYYREVFALESECRGGQLSKLADSFITGTGVVTGLSHLEDETVVVWADGVDQGSHLVVAGALPTLTDTFTTWCAGLPYQARFKSAKLAGQTRMGVSLTQRSRINSLGLILADTHAQGLEFGPDFDTLDPLPLVENGAAVDGNAVWEAYDEDMIEFPGDWDTDNRICLVANAPRPCTVLAAVINVDRHDHD